MATVTNLGPGSDTFDLALSGPLGPTVTASATSITLASGASSTINLAVGDAAAFARPGNNPLLTFACHLARRSSANASASATVTVPQRLAVSVTGSRPATQSAGAAATRTVGNIDQSR